MPIYLYTLLIDEDELYEIDLNDTHSTNTNCMSFILYHFNKIKII